MSWGAPAACNEAGDRVGARFENGQVFLPEGFAAAVVRLLEDDGAARRLGTRARRLVEERYDADRIGRDLAGFYGELIRDRSRRPVDALEGPPGADEGLGLPAPRGTSVPPEKR